MLNSATNILREKAFFYKVETPPANAPVTLDDFKAYAKITNDAENDTLQLILDSAISFGQAYTRRTFITTEFKTFRDEFIDRARFIELRKSPFQSLTSFKYYNESETLVDVDSSTYMTTQDEFYSKIALLDGSEYPNDVSNVRPFQVIEIIFKAGYGDTSADVPEGIRTAIMAHALNVARNRGDCGDSCNESNLPSAAKGLYQQFKIPELRLGF
jgi:uncharacterized phiE125 gp8 family phage protein